VNRPTYEHAKNAAEKIAPFINATPIYMWKGRLLDERVAAGTEVLLKLELFQRAGSFKTRGALLGILALDETARARGVTAVSAGNHAIAVSYAANALGVDAKVVMQSSANRARVTAAEAFGAEVIIGGDGPACFALAEKIVQEEGRTFIHPFDGENVTLGTATLGVEFCEQAGPLDAIIIPVGGGGLASGVALMAKKLMPGCHVYGVEPTGADSMSRSFVAGVPQTLAKVSTISDSLAPPMTLPYSFGLCRENIDEMVTIDDDEIRSAMRLLFDEMKLAVEPAAAAGTAALIGPLRDSLAGKRVGVIICGTNVDPDTHARLLQGTRQT
jgi:threonine dehydratase